MAQVEIAPAARPVSARAAINSGNVRVREAAQLGFKRCILPHANLDPADRPLADGGCELTGVGTVSEALDALLV